MGRRSEGVGVWVWCCGGWLFGVLGWGFGLRVATFWISGGLDGMCHLCLSHRA